MTLPIPSNLAPYLVIFGLAYVVLQAFLSEGDHERDNIFNVKIREMCGSVKRFFGSVIESLNAFASEYNDSYVEKEKEEKEKEEKEEQREEVKKEK
jgi:hypothetical protein